MNYDRELCILGLGSTIANRHKNIKIAIQKLQGYNFKIEKISNLYKTEPVDCLEGTPFFCNAVIGGFFDKSPNDLLEICQSIEIEMGRPLVHRQDESRIIDIDILFFGNLIFQTADLIIPHLRISQRLFVLEPLCQLYPQFVHPITKCTAKEMFNSINKQLLEA